jgi:hypothetical protein
MINVRIKGKWGTHTSSLQLSLLKKPHSCLLPNNDKLIVSVEGKEDCSHLNTVKWEDTPLEWCAGCGAIKNHNSKKRGWELPDPRLRAVKKQ